MLCIILYSLFWFCQVTVGEGFEPSCPCTGPTDFQSVPFGLSGNPLVFGRGDRIRTCGPRFRNQLISSEPHSTALALLYNSIHFLCLLFLFFWSKILSQPSRYFRSLAPLRRPSPFPPCHLPLITRLGVTRCDRLIPIRLLVLQTKMCHFS